MLLQSKRKFLLVNVLPGTGLYEGNDRLYNLFYSLRGFDEIFFSFCRTGLCDLVRKGENFSFPSPCVWLQRESRRPPSPEREIEFLDTLETSKHSSSIFSECSLNNLYTFSINDWNIVIRKMIVFRKIRTISFHSAGQLRFHLDPSKGLNRKRKKLMQFLTRIIVRGTLV